MTATNWTARQTSVDSAFARYGVDSEAEDPAGIRVPSPVAHPMRRLMYTGGPKIVQMAHQQLLAYGLHYNANRIIFG
jgi:hypothetical protein